MYDNKVRFFFSIKNISQEHYIFRYMLNELTTIRTSVPRCPVGRHIGCTWTTWRLGRNIQSAVALPSNRRLKLWQQIFIETKQNFRITVQIAFSTTSRVMMDEYADAKWNLPGWRIEQKYNTDVLIGNWNEERRVVRTLCIKKFSD